MFAQARHMLLPKDYIYYKMAGEYTLDKANSSSTALCNLKSHSYSDETLAASGIQVCEMPEAFDGNEKKIEINFLFLTMFLSMRCIYELYSSKVGNMQFLFRESHGDNVNCEERKEIKTNTEYASNP